MVIFKLLTVISLLFQAVNYVWLILLAHISSRQPCLAYLQAHISSELLFKMHQPYSTYFTSIYFRLTFYQLHSHVAIAFLLAYASNIVLLIIQIIVFDTIFIAIHCSTFRFYACYQLISRIIQTINFIQLRIIHIM